MTRGWKLDGGGVLEGTVDEIGWSKDRVLARVTRIYREDPDGWYELDVASGKIRGPLSEGEIAADSALRDIRCHPPDQD